MASLFVYVGARTAFGVSRGTPVAAVWSAQTNHPHLQRRDWRLAFDGAKGYRGSLYS